MATTDDSTLLHLLQTSRTIAVVGCSPRPERDSHHVAAYLAEHGYTVWPVNPTVREITLNGTVHPCYPDLASLPAAPDLVDVFRKSEDAEAVAREAIAAHAKALWLQLGVISPTAETLAHEAGLVTVMDRCILIEHRRLLPPR